MFLGLPAGWSVWGCVAMSTGLTGQIYQILLVQLRRGLRRVMLWRLPANVPVILQQAFEACTGGTAVVWCDCVCTPGCCFMWPCPMRGACGGAYVAMPKSCAAFALKSWTKPLHACPPPPSYFTHGVPTTSDHTMLPYRHHATHPLSIAHTSNIIYTHTQYTGATCCKITGGGSGGTVCILAAGTPEGDAAVARVAARYADEHGSKTKVCRDSVAAGAAWPQ